MNRAAAVAVVIGLSGVFWIQGERFLAANGPTYDEAVHLAAGYSYFATGDFRLNIEDPPLLKLLWAAPGYWSDPERIRIDPKSWDKADEWSVGQAFLYDNPRATTFELLTPARRVNLALGVVLLWLTGWWAYRLWKSPWAGVTAAALTAFDPTIQAMACILSTDLGLTLFATASFYLFWEYLTVPTSRKLHLLGLAVGLMLGSKFSAVVVVAALVLTLLLYLFAGGSVAMPGESPSEVGLGTRLRNAIGPLVRVGLIAGLTLVPLYFVIHFPDWGMGLKQQLVRHQFGDPWFYFLGEVSNRPWWLYFPVALLVKSPLGTLVLLALSLFLGVVQNQPWRQVFLVVGPATLFFLGMMFSGVDVGVRVVLPVFPALFVIASRLAVPPLGWTRAFIVLVCLLATAYSGIRSAPYQLTYFNELAGGPEGGIHILGDSNLDWGQTLPELAQYQDHQAIPILYLAYHGTAPPRAFGVRYQFLPASGYLEPPPSDQVPVDAKRHVVAVSATCLQGIYLPAYDLEHNLYRWMLDRTPTAILGNTIYIYDLTGDPEAIARIRQIATSSR